MLTISYQCHQCEAEQVPERKRRFIYHSSGVLCARHRSPAHLEHDDGPKVQPESMLTFEVKERSKRLAIR